MEQIKFYTQVEYANWCRTEGKSLYFRTLTGPFDALPVIVEVGQEMLM